MCTPPAIISLKTLLACAILAPAFHGQDSAKAAQRAVLVENFTSHG